jgi:alkylated DNA repair dioxygenase AlkB
VSQQSLYPEAATESLALPGAELLLLREPGLGESRLALLDALILETAWREESITLYGKTHLQPRLVAWYGDRDAAYRYSGRTYQPHPWTPRLAALRDRMEQLAGARFNSVLLNYYRDHRDSMGLHADDEPELGEQPVIASLSLGEERVLYFRHKRERGVRGLDLPLPDGSVLLMRGETQANWKHGMRKLSRPCGPRVNLTFRWVYSRQA